MRKKLKPKQSPAIQAIPNQAKEKVNYLNSIFLNPNSSINIYKKKLKLKIQIANYQMHIVQFMSRLHGMNGGRKWDSSNQKLL